MNKRINQTESDMIQVLRTIMVIIVIYAHASFSGVNTTEGRIEFTLPQTLSLVEQIINLYFSRTSIALFLFFSGILLYRKEFTFKENLKKKTHTIFIPFVIFNTAWIIILFIIQAIPQFRHFFSQPELIVRSFSFRDFVSAYFGYEAFLYPMWFLRDLFIMNILARPIQYAINKAPHLFFLISAGLWLGCVQLWIVRPESLFFFSLGYYYHKYDISLEKISRSNIWHALIIYAIMIVLALRITDGLPGMIISRICIASGIPAFLCFANRLCKYKKTKELLIPLAAFSFFIYCYHEYFLRILIKACGKFIPQTYFTLTIEYITIPFVIFIFALFSGMFLRKYLPAVYSVVNGARR